MNTKTAALGVFLGLLATVFVIDMCLRLSASKPLPPKTPLAQAPMNTSTNPTVQPGSVPSEVDTSNMDTQPHQSTNNASSDAEPSTTNGSADTPKPAVVSRTQPIQSDQAGRANEELDQQVSDYNNCLRRAKDDFRSDEVLTKRYINALNANGPNPQLLADFNNNTDSIMRDWHGCVYKALVLSNSFNSNSAFSRKYCYTTLAFDYSEAPTDLPGAQNLRFVELR